MLVPEIPRGIEYRALQRVTPCGKGGPSPTAVPGAQRVPQDMAGDVRAQELIAKEVNDFMRTTGPVTENHLGILEDRIRAALSGKTPPPLSLSLQRQQVIENDEWARLALFNQKVAEKEQRERQEQLARERDEIREVLARQMEERKKKAEEEMELGLKYHEMEMKELKEWEAAEEEKLRAKRAVAERIKEEREAQVVETAAQRETIRDLRMQEEQSLLVEMAKKYKAEQLAERRRKEEARAMLERVKEDNKVLLVKKEEDRKKLIEEDLDYQRQYNAILDKQAAEREARLEAAKVWQTRNEARVKTMQAEKEWIPKEVEERYLREREEREAAEDERRKAAILAARDELRRDLDLQVQLKKQEKEAAKREQLEYGLKLVAEAEDEERRKAAAKAEELAKQKVLRAELTEQMKLNAKLKQVVLMTDEEKRINRELIERVTEFRSTGRVNAGSRTGVLG